ncbi:MAG: hypothetical protein ACNYPE_15940 [Candidatus Azotimanducaceae bacterium WSBS_2022_MAG_OTU7]
MTVNMNPDGTGTIVEGSPDIGSSRASVQMMAEVLQIEPKHLKPIVLTLITFRTARAQGVVGQHSQQVWLSLKHLKKLSRVKERATAVWNVTAEQVDYADGVASNTARAKIP